MSALRTARPDGWPERLQAVVQASAQRPFGWGTHDCCTLAADAVQACTGFDFAGHWRGQGNAREALRWMRQPGLRRLATEVLGAPVAPALAQRGDVVLLPAGKRQALGVCLGEVAVAPAAVGLASVPMDAALLAWRV